MNLSESKTEMLLQEEPETAIIKQMATRRSSIFRKSVITEPVNFSDVYESKLKKEDDTWKNLYTRVKTEFFTLRNKENKGGATNLDPLDVCFRDAEDYLQKANDFFERMNILQEMNKYIVNQKKKKIIELEQEIKFIEKKMVTVLDKNL